MGSKSGDDAAKFPIFGLQRQGLRPLAHHPSRAARVTPALKISCGWAFRLGDLPKGLAVTATKEFRTAGIRDGSPGFPPPSTLDVQREEAKPPLPSHPQGRDRQWLRVDQSPADTVYVQILDSTAMDTHSFLRLTSIARGHDARRRLWNRLLYIRDKFLRHGILDRLW